MKALKLVIGLCVAAAAVTALVVLPVREWLLQLVTWMRAAGAAGIAGYAAVYLVFAVVMLPGSMLSVTAGFAFGPIWGPLIGTTTATFAAIVPFTLGRFVAREWVMRRASQYPKLEAIDAATYEQGFKVVFLLRMSLAPYNVLNYALGLTKVRLGHFVVASWLGLLPAVSVLAYVGSLITDAAQLGTAVSGASGGVRVLYYVGFATTVGGVVLLTRMARRALREVLRTSREGHDTRGATGDAVQG
ncbi:MAG: TVP38/TMEM64 family protein [Myxococcaceae bacterium]|nr:TVP38/TMEM64 family protein [Myxococcaceae bacterium]